MKTSTQPTYEIALNDHIHCFELSPNEKSQNLVAIAIPKKIILGEIKFVKELDNTTLEWNIHRQFDFSPRCNVLAFSPHTTLADLPQKVEICLATSDLTLSILRSDLRTTELMELKGHTSFINDVAWEPSGDYLASVSDDHKCKIWSVHDNFECIANVCLESAGMSVKWHPDEGAKVLVAEKKGIIHLYCAKSGKILVSVESPKIPLMYADWALSNELNIAAIAGGEIAIWNLKNSCRPIEIRSFHEDAGRIVKFSPNNETLTASIGRPDVTLKVTSKKSNPQIEASLKVYGGLCWHYRLPYVAVANDRKLCFYRVQIK